MSEPTAETGQEATTNTPDAETPKPEAPTNSPPIKPRGRRRRCSVSAEADSDPSQMGGEIKVVPKTEEEMERIVKSVEKNFLFSSLDKEQQQQIFGAMEEKKVAAGEVIIQQGDTGDFFYVLDSGEADVYVEEQKVHTYYDGSSFGELALMYNCPRAATVQANKDCTVWSLERALFRRILYANQSQKKGKYESFLKGCEIFSNVDAGEISKIADVLEERTFDENEVVIEQGDENIADMRFYMVIEGEAVANQKQGDETVNVGHIKPGGFFGEKALLEKQARAATVTAYGGPLTCASLDVAAFERLLGSCKELMLRHIGTYSCESIELPSGSALNAVRAMSTSGSQSSLVANAEGGADDAEQEQLTEPVAEQQS